MKTVLILRGVSGSGKTTFAETLKALNPDRVAICSADDYFYDEKDHYNFDPSALGKAHLYCQSLFHVAMENENIDLIVVANTNTKPSDFAYYVNAAEGRAIVTTVVIENRHCNSDVHAVPDQIKQRQKQNLFNTIVL
jgi:uridine kinase